jgi:hypothetical protein
MEVRNTTRGFRAAILTPKSNRYVSLEVPLQDEIAASMSSTSDALIDTLFEVDLATAFF